MEHSAVSSRLVIETVRHGNLNLEAVCWYSLSQLLVGEDEALCHTIAHSSETTKFTARLEICAMPEYECSNLLRGFHIRRC